MRRFRATAVVVATTTALVSASSAISVARGPDGVGNQFYVVGFRSLPRSLGSGDRFLGATVQRVDPMLGFARVVAANPSEFRSKAKADPRVRYVEQDPELQLIEFTPNDPRYAEQYGPQHVRTPEAWDTTLGDLDAKVCIVDTGVRYTHEDVAGFRWLGGTDFFNGDPDPMDDNGHGTHVAGIAAASINNGKGIAGLANVGIYGVKVLSSVGSAPWSTVASGIRWCADNAGSRVVINMSLGGSVGATVLQDAVRYAYGKGALLVAAAGNSGPCSNCVLYPAKYQEVVAVTCTTASKSQCAFSSDGPESELAAPGDLILSAWSSGDAAYATKSGTSMSSPHVSGVAALVWSQVTDLTNAGLRQHMRDEAQDLGGPGWDELFGYGLVDAKATLDAALVPPPPESRVLFEDFDDGVANGWTLSGLWHLSSVCSVPPSIPNYLGYNKDSDCRFSTGARTTGTATFDVDLTARTAATLNLAHRFEKEVYAGGAFDVMRVQVSTNGGSTWTTLRQWDSRNPNQLAWTPQSVDLDAYAGAPVKLRFFFDSVDNVANAYAGWLVDNVEVTAAVTNQPPVANAGPDQTVADADNSGGEAVTLDGTGSTDPDGTITSYEWRESGAPIATGPTASVTLGVGAHLVSLTVTDDGGAADSDDVVITVRANEPPTAAFSSTVVGLTVDVDGTASSDADGTIAGYAWTWGDGTPDGSGVTASHTYATPGNYTVTLTVSDNGGATGSISKTVAAGEARVLFEDFDDGAANGWALTGLWHVSSLCSVPPSTPNYLGYNKDSDCRFSTGARTTGVATFDADLTGRTAATLNFNHRFEKETYSGGAYDVMRVQVSMNGGSTWITLKQWDSRNPNQLAWTAYSADLDVYAGGPVKLRFFFDSVDHISNSYAGWFLDDVEVTAS